MPIQVFSEIEAFSHERPINGTFSSVQEFLASGATASDFLVELFQLGVPAEGSDQNITIRDVDGGDELEYAQVYQAFRNPASLPDGFELIARRGSGGKAVFRYEEIAGPMPSSRLQGVGRTGDIRLGNSSKRVDEIKEWLYSDEGHTMVKEALCDIRSVPMWNGVQLDSVEQVQEHYAQLGCVLFQIELFYGTSAIHKGMQHKIKAAYTCSSTHLEPSIQNMSVPRVISNAMRRYKHANYLVQKVLGHLDEEMPLDTPRQRCHPITERELALMSRFLGIDFFLFETYMYADMYEIFNKTNFDRVVLAKTKTLGKFKDRVKKRAPAMMICRSGRTKGQVAARMQCQSTMVFRVSDIWKETMHVEAELNAGVVQTFMNKTWKYIDPVVEYKSGNIDQDGYIARLLAGGSSMLASPMYTKRCVFDYAMALNEHIPKTITIESAVELHQRLGSFSIAVSEFETEYAKFMVGEEEVSLKDAFFRLRERLPSVVYFSHKLFMDANESKKLTTIEPFNTHGIRTTLDLFGYIMWRINCSSDRLCSFEFVNAESLMTPNLVRSFFQHHMRVNQGEMVMGNTDGGIHVYTLQGLRSFMVRFKLDLYMDQGDLKDITIVFHPQEHDQLQTTTQLVNGKSDLLPFTKTIDEAVDQVTSALEQIDFADENHRTAMLEHINSREGVIYKLSKSNLLWEIFCLQKGKYWEKHKTGIHYLIPFEEIMPIQLEPLFAYNTTLFEPMVVSATDGSGYQNQPNLVEIDLSKMYTHILQGAYVRIWTKDLYGCSPQIGGLLNPTYQEITEPISSYFADFGLVLIEGCRINWRLLREISPIIFRTTMSWYHRRYRVAFVDAYVLIHLCQYVWAYRHTRVGRVYKSLSVDQFYKTIQFKGLGIRHGIFDFTPTERKMFKSGPPDEFSYDRLKDDFGPIVNNALESRYSVPKQLKICKTGPATPDQLSRGLFAHPPRKVLIDESTWKRRPKEIVDMENKFSWVCARMADANLRMFGALEDKDEAWKAVKQQNNNLVGRLKYCTTSGMNHRQVADMIKTAQKPPLYRGKRRRVEGNMFHTPLVENSAYFSADIPGTEDSLMVRLSCKFSIARNSLASFRRYILNTGQAIMDDLAIYSDAFRVVTDSVLVSPEFQQEIEDRILIQSGIQARTMPEEPIVGNMGLFKSTTIDVTGDYVEPKYRRVVEPCPVPPHHADVPHRMKESDQMVLDAQLEPFNEIKDSDMFYEWYSHNYIDIHGAANGAELHEKLFPLYNVDPQVREAYEAYTLSSAERILELQGAILVGEPGAGKTQRTKAMCKLAYEQKLSPVVTAQMHAVVRLYGDCQDEVGEKYAESMTIHSFCGCQTSVKSNARFPDQVLENHVTRHMSMPKRHKIIFCEEIETFDKAFEEYLKRCKEQWGCIVYLVGDPLQSAPMFSRGFDMFGSVAKFLGNNTIVRFDLQFRNMDEQYRRGLKITAGGDLLTYLDRNMSRYLQDEYAMCELDIQIDKVAEQLAQGKPVSRTFACPNYNTNVALVTRILREAVSKGLYTDNVLVHTGCEAHERDNYNAIEEDQETLTQKEIEKQERSFVYMASREPQRRGGVMRSCSSKTYLSDRNGPSGKTTLVGTPLVMNNGIQFCVQTRFKGKWENPAMGQTRQWVEKGAVLTLRNKHMCNNVPTLMGEEKTILSFARYTFQDECGATVNLTEMEVCMYCYYAFAIQREFILGMTLDSLTVIQPYAKKKNGREGYLSHYVPIEETLRQLVKRYGSDSVHTKLGRFMRVAATRVRNPSETCIMDIEVEDKFFWGATMWDHSRWMVLHHREMKWYRWAKYASCMRKVILFGRAQFEWTAKHSDFAAQGASRDRVSRYSKFPKTHLVHEKEFIPKDVEFPQVPYAIYHRYIECQLDEKDVVMQCALDDILDHNPMDEDDFAVSDPIDIEGLLDDLEPLPV